MSMNGQLSDLHLSELIEFFCNQRKTGRLKLDYALAPGVFFIKDGELVDAKVGTLNGKDAVFFALTLPSAAFDFSAGMNSSRRTINESWASVVLEGLRRIDEGVMPEFDAFVGEEEVDEATLEYLSCLEEAKGKEVAAAKADAAKAAAEKKESDKKESGAPAFAPLSMTVEASSSSSGGRSKAMIAGVVAALVLVCAVAAIPVSRRLARKEAPAAVSTPQQASAPAPVETPAETSAGDAANTPAEASATDTAAAEEAARHDQQQREARERARKQREEAAKNAAQDQTVTNDAPKPAPTTPSGAKTVRVQINYDEAGRVTQAAAIGTSPGAEAYAATAVRVARSRHFTPGKAGSTVVTIPIN